MQNEPTMEEVLRRIREMFADEAPCIQSRCLDAIDAVEAVLWHIGPTIARCSEGPTKMLLEKHRALLQQALDDAKDRSLALR